MNTTMTAPAKMTPATFASALGWNVKNVGARLGALDLLATCSRCGGGGRFSYNQMTGDRCFGCNGSGRALPKLTSTLVAHVKSAVVAGGLDAYLANVSAQAAAKATIAPIAEQIAAAYAPIGEAYMDAYRASNHDGYDEVSRLQSLANAIRYSSPGGAKHSDNPRAWGLSEIERSGLTNSVLIAEILTERLDQIRVCAAGLESLRAAGRLAPSQK